MADLCVQAILMDAIKRAAPSDHIIAEEDLEHIPPHLLPEVQKVLSGIGLSLADLPKRGADGPLDHRRFWAIDPIDGTKGFMRNGQYAICVALIEDGQVTASFIACPNYPIEQESEPGAVFVALKGRGAVMLSLRGASMTRLEGRIEPMQGSRLCQSFEASHTSHDAARALILALHLDPEPIRMDSQCKYCLLAQGRAGLYFRKVPREDYVEKVWDHAPGYLLVRETGGQVTDFAGQDILFTCDSLLRSVRGGIIASKFSPADHRGVLDYLEGALLS